MAVLSINGYDSYSGCDIVVTASLPKSLADDASDDIYFTLGSLQTLSISTHQDKRPVRSLGNMNAKDYVMGQRTIAGSLVFAVFDRHFADRIMKAAGVIIPDEIPALDLTITFANEYGRSSRMVVYGVKIINEGQVMSINDLYTENTYQFVALGLEPLTAEEGRPSSGKGKKKPKNIIKPKEEYIKEIADKPEVVKSSGKAISDKIKNNQGYANKEAIVLTASVEQPLNSETTGLTTLILQPMQQEGFIYITNLTTNNLEKTITVNGSNSYYAELPIGFYNARYMNTTRVKESNIEKIVVKRIESKIKELKNFTNIYPIIENVSDNSITVALYDTNLNSIICYTDGDVEQIKANKGKTVTFYNLKANTLYEIYGTDGANKSSAVSVRTYHDRNVHYKMFKEFLKANRNMLQNDYDAMIKALDSLLEFVNGVLEWVFTNIVSGLILLADSVIKQELLLYAIQFENSTLEAYNHQNPYQLNIIQNNVFDVDFDIENWTITKYYSNQDNKFKLEGIISPGVSFDGRPNNVYSLYGINDNISSVKKFITVFTAEGKEFLSKYRDCNKYKLLDTSYNKAMYPSLDTNEIYALTIRDNHLCDRQLLEEPYAYIEDGEAYVDVTYDDKILLDSSYYMCISEIYKTLDPIPCRKVSFNRQTKIINLKEHYIPLNPDKYYHIWIENTAGNVISKTFLFNYKQSPALTKALDKELMNALASKKNLLIDKINNNMLTDIVNILYADSVPMKDLDKRLELELLTYGTKSFNVPDVMRDLLYEVVLVNTSNKLNVTRANKAVVNLLNRQIRIFSGTDLTTKIVTKSYDVINKAINCSIYYSEEIINITGDYMVLYLINDYIDKVLGFIVIDCSDCDCKALGFNIEMK